ncbi:hypothetical protein [Geobacter sp. SVR]|uniref:hypothetical protein n=1 Tax=Geobacter sp. SVR TaxID=2495594 RepID=UPI001EF29AE8|nr:hypothetical protein [Geobacter sp. SVR]
MAETSLLPLAVTLLFGLHPLSTESVNWVSGRTDLLSGFFLLLATLCLLCYRETSFRLHVYAAMLCIVLATLTKEFALAFLPGAAFVLAAHDSADNKTGALQRNVRRIILTTVIITTSVAALFFALRLVAFSTNSSRIAMTLRFILVDPLHTAKVFMGAFAFYLKKIFIPWPLNFAIVEIDPLYELLAIPLLVICLFVLIKRNMASSLFLTGVLLFTPSFVIAFNQIAWTPYAERYAYLSTAYVVLSVALYSVNRWGEQLKQLMIPVVAFLLCIGGGTTLVRNITWQTNSSLIHDTVVKSPDVANIRLLYGAQLAERGQLDEALNQFEQGKRLPGLGYDERFDLNIAAILLERHQRDEAIALLEEAVKRSKGRSERPMRELLTLLDKKLVRSRDVMERDMLGKRIILLRKDIYRLTHDATEFDGMRDTAHLIGDTELERRFAKLSERSPNKQP